MRSAFAAIYMREIRVAGRIGGSGSMGVVFFLTLVTITPFAVGPDPNLLARIGPAMLWISALLASLLGLDRLFQADAEDGSLDSSIFHTRRWNWRCSPNAPRIGRRRDCRWCLRRRC